MALFGRKDQPIEQMSAQRTSSLSVLSVSAVFIACLFGGLTLFLHLHYSGDANNFLRSAEAQRATSERLVRQAIIAGQPGARWLPVSRVQAAGAARDFRQALSEFKAGHQALRYGDPATGLGIPTDQAVVNALNTVDGKSKASGAIVTLGERIESGGFSINRDRKLIAGLSKLVSEYQAALTKSVNAVKPTLEARSKIATTGFVIAGIVALIGLFGVLTTAVQGNLARLNSMIRKLRDTETKLKDSLEESRTALQLSHMASKRFEQLFGSIPIGCFTCDAEGVIFEWNEAAERLTGYAAHEVYMKSIYETIYANASLDRVKSMIAKVMAGETILGVELEERRQDGTEYSVMVNLLPLRGGNDEITSVICANADITVLKEREKELADSREELRLANSRLHALATTDGLTGLNNHRSFQEQLEHDFNDAKTKGKPLSLVLLDVDRFKQYNDNFGHMAGDTVLRDVAKVLKATAPDGFMVARYGGEEFVIVMPMVGADIAVQVTEMIRVAIAERKWPNREVTASFGIATYDPRYEQPAQMIAEADQALYYSKDAGRNRVTHFDAMPEGVDRRKAA